MYGVILWIFPSLLTAIAMVREKEKGTILQVYASSISATELLLGKGMAYLLIAITEALIVIGLGTIIFQVGLVNNPITLLLGTLIFLIDSVMFGLLVGVRSNNQNSAVQIISLVGFITSLLLSGFIYPLSNIPFPLSLVTAAVPPLHRRLHRRRRNGRPLSPPLRHRCHALQPTCPPNITLPHSISSLRHLRGHHRCHPALQRRTCLRPLLRHTPLEGHLLPLLPRETAPLLFHLAVELANVKVRS